MELKITFFKLISSVRNEALTMNEKSVPSPYLFNQIVNKIDCRVGVNLENSKNLSIRKQHYINHSFALETDEPIEPAIRNESLHKYIFKKLTFVHIGSKEGIEVSFWYDVKQIVYNYFQKVGLKQISSSFIRNYKYKTDRRIPITLNNEIYY